MSAGRTSRRRRRDEKIRDLGEVNLFSLCNQKELARIASLSDLVEAEEGETLLREGAAGAAQAFVIVAGEVEVSLRGRPLAVLGPGEIVGEMALLGTAPRAATVRTRTPVTAYVIGSREFTTLLEDAPRVGRKILQALATRLRNTMALDV